ncbi:MAG: AAA family ATPase [bacterium]
MSTGLSDVNRAADVVPLPPELIDDLQALNPWWIGKPGAPLPTFRRSLYAGLLQSVQHGLTPVTALRGPRRVGKTILVRQIIEGLLAAGTPPKHLLYVPFDDIRAAAKLMDPVLQISRWFERHVLGRTFNETAHAGQTAYLFFDEIQNLKAWAPQLKHLVDNHAVRVLITGSSSLQIEAGRDSLAGRLMPLDIGTLLLREIAELRFGHSEPSRWPPNGQGDLTSLDFWRQTMSAMAGSAAFRKRAFVAYSQVGGYPMAHQLPTPAWSQVSDYLMETVIRRVLTHDLPVARRRQPGDAQFMEEVFRLACRYAGQTPGPAVFGPDLRTILHKDYTWNRVRRVLGTLDATLLLKLVPPLEIRLKRQTAPAKICLCDHALRAAWLQEQIPLDPDGLAKEPHLSDLAGRIAESVLGYFLASIPNLDVAHFPARASEPEVDFIITIGTKRIPVEVKYRKRIDPHEDTRGLRAFLEKSVYNAPLGLLVTLEDGVTVPDPRIVPISLSSFLWMR